MTKANAAEIERWNTQAGKTWARFQVQLDRQMRDIGEATRAALSAELPKRDGLRVLDVGCGAGETTVDIASALGAGAEVTGLDVSRPMLQIARTRPLPAGAAKVAFLEADAQTFAFEPHVFDALFSRFGVMFFDDPVAAFANLRTAAKPGAPFVFACWRPMEENPWLGLPLQAASFVPRPSIDPHAPGPFAFADADRLRSILESAGWRDIGIRPLDLEAGGLTLDETAHMTTRIGPLGGALKLADADDELIARAVEAVRDAFRTYERPDGVFMPAAIWMVTARA